MVGLKVLRRSERGGTDGAADELLDIGNLPVTDPCAWFVRLEGALV